MAHLSIFQMRMIWWVLIPALVFARKFDLIKNHFKHEVAFLGVSQITKKIEIPEIENSRDIPKVKNSKKI